ncbi:hypothetical protein BHQ19_12885 [Mycolicibacterium porcinum]|nr:hypothetical protein BHQ19_12885 [Mycolicibacterium porcinum]
MVIVGFVSLIVGLKTDVSQSDWSQSLGFFTNIWAGFTGFLIGVPVALVVLSTITAQREETAATDRVHTLTRIAWEQFRDAVYELFGEKRIDSLESIAGTVQAYHDQTFKGFENYEQGEKTTEDYENLMAFIDHQVKTWQQPFVRVMHEIGNSYDLGMSWYAVLRDWNTLDQYVRLQRLERGLEWFDRRPDSLLQQAMNPNVHPMQPFFDKHEGPTPKYPDWKNGSMWAAFNALYHYREIETEDAFRMELVMWGRYFPGTPVKGYLEAVGETALNMRQILYVVQEIDRSDWLNPTGPGG